MKRYFVAINGEMAILEDEITEDDRASDLHPAVDAARRQLGPLGVTVEDAYVIGEDEV